MKTIIDRSECNPLSNHILGKLVVVVSDFFLPEFRDAKYQIVLATGGFGCYAEKLGSSSSTIFVTEVHRDKPEKYRLNRRYLIGEPTEEIIKEWKILYGEFNEEVQEALEV